MNEPIPTDHRRRHRIIFAILAVLAFVTILRLALGTTFFSDEWAFIESRSLTDPTTWLVPHNEHWSTIPVLVYRAMVETVGIGSYLPYLALLALLHMVVATLVYGLLERSSGPLLALGGATIVLFFGSGLENLYWAFQIGSVGALALGLGAVWLTELGPTRGRALAAATLLLASVATQGVGLFMCVVVGIEWLLDPRWRRYLVFLALPAAAFIAWYLAIGRFGASTFRNPLSSDALLAIPPSILRGLSNAFGAIAGLPLLGFLVFAAFGIWGVRKLVRHDLHPRVIGLLAAIAVEYALIGAGRAQLFDGAIEYTRYTYVSGVLAMLAFGLVAGRIELPQQGRARSFGMVVLGGWLALALTVNVGLLVLGRNVFLAHADMTRALIDVALDPHPPDGAQLDRGLRLVPAATTTRRLVASYGDPRTDALVPWAVRPIPADVMDEARRWLIEGAPTT